MDNGSGSAILLEVARVLDAAQVQPPTDLFLAWFGSEELSLYGSFQFAATHQELLDRTRAMLQVDCLSRPLDGIDAELRLVTWPYGRLGDDRMLWPEAVAQLAAGQGVEAVPYAAYYPYSDNSPFGNFAVPNADLIYEPVVDPDASIHAAGTLHDPYDTIDLAREMGDVLEQMARVALTAALDAAQEDTTLRVTPPPD
jgi:Zn-dependent M28 family amino/carboxypeptidase